MQLEAISGKAALISLARGSLHALRYLSNARYSKNSEKCYYMLQK